MKAEIKVSTQMVKEHGCVCAVVLGIINSAVEPLSIKNVANMIGVSIPTAAKALNDLYNDRQIQVSGEYDKKYFKI